MFKYNHKLVPLLLLLLGALLLTGAAAQKWKSLQFTNPGSKRLLKTGGGNHYYYRSLPEQSMLLDVKDLTSVEIRAIAKAKVANPMIILKYGGKRYINELKIASISEKYQVYQPLQINIPQGVKQLELVSYNRNIYYRAFRPVQPVVKKTSVPPLKMLSDNKPYKVDNGKTTTAYYAFKDTAPLTFQINKGKPFSLYVRAELSGEEAPVFAVYANGQLIRQYTLSIKETSAYKVEGLPHLTVGRKIDFEAADKITRYELKAVSAHLFIAKPVIRKVK
jgi:hypothetical protein